MSILIKNERLVIDNRIFPLDNYRIIEEIGRGANAVVFLVVNDILGRNEALKLWLPRKGQSAVDKNRFFAEIRKNAQFTEDSTITTIYSGNVWGDIYYCIMEYCPGIQLKEYLESNPSWIARWGLSRSISDTLKIIYDKGFYHGDLHDRNIIVDSGSQYWFKILDFGTSIFSGKEMSLKRDAELLFKLSLELFVPPLAEVVFYNNSEIRNLPAPMINNAFRVVISISNPKPINFKILNGSFTADCYMKPEYSEIEVFMLVSMLKTTPVFNLDLVNQFLADISYPFEKQQTFYQELYKTYSPDHQATATMLSDIKMVVSSVYSQHREGYISDILKKT